MKWFTYGWYNYLFKDNTGIRNIICRVRGHPSGPVWYTMTKYEPDMTCKDCGEEI